MIGSMVLAAVNVSLLLTAQDAKTEQSPPTIDRAVVERMAVAAEKALPKGRRLRARVETEWYKAADGAQHVDAKQAPYLAESHLLSMWGTRETCERFVSLHADRSYAKTFAGGYVYNIVLNENDCFVQQSELYDVDNFGLALVAQVDVPGVVGGKGSVAEVIRKGTPLALEESGTRISYRLVPPGAQEAFDKYADENKRPRFKAWPYGAVIDTSDPPRLVEVWMELPVTKSSQGKDVPPRIDRWTVVEWQTIGNDTIARLIRRTTTNPENGSEIVELVKVVDAEAIDPKVPAPPVLADGFKVEDQKLKLSFVVGSRDITYQGRSLRLKEPLREHPGARLEELIATAEAR